MGLGWDLYGCVDLGGRRFFLKKPIIPKWFVTAVSVSHIAPSCQSRIVYFKVSWVSRARVASSINHSKLKNLINVIYQVSKDYITWSQQTQIVERRLAHMKARTEPLYTLYFWASFVYIIAMSILMFNKVYIFMFLKKDNKTSQDGIHLNKN